MCSLVVRKKSLPTTPPNALQCQCKAICVKIPIFHRNLARENKPCFDRMGGNLGYRQTSVPIGHYVLIGHHRALI